MNYQKLHFDTIDSTSTFLKQNFAQMNDFTFVSADFQTQGRGRNNRAWLSKKGENLMFSFLIKDEALLSCYKDLSLASAYVLAKVLEKKYDLEPSIKWPNDVYLSGKKMCGILLESHMSDGRIDGIIIGIGINVNQKEFPSELLYPVTSIGLEAGKEIDLNSLRDDLFEEIASYFPLIKEGRKDHIEYARRKDFLMGKRVNATIHEEKKQVEVMTINDDCSLKVMVDGKEMDLISGEITFH